MKFYEYYEVFVFINSGSKKIIMIKDWYNDLKDVGSWF